MQEITYGIDELLKKLEDLEKSLPHLRQELHEKIGESIKTELHAEIDVGLNDDNDHVKKAQDSFVGSRGGYVAIRAITGAFPGDNRSGERGKNAGAITNYLENGHRMVLPNEKDSKNNASRRVAGRYFYMKTRIKAENIAMKACKEFSAEVVEALKK